MTTQRIRLPNGLKPSAPAPAGGDAEAQVLSDRDPLREIVAGLDWLESLVDQTHIALDTLAAAGRLDDAPLHPLALILKRRDGQAHAVPPQRTVPLLRCICRDWRPARKAPVQSVPAPPA